MSLMTITLHTHAIVLLFKSGAGQSNSLSKLAESAALAPQPVVINTSKAAKMLTNSVSCSRITFSGLI